MVLVWTVALSVAAVVLPRAAHAAFSAMDKCTMGLTPDLVQTTYFHGNMNAATFPAETDPHNAFYPGDVVRVTTFGFVSYNLLGHRALPIGNGAVASAAYPYPGFQEISLIARFNNNPGGWVGAPMAATSLESCTTAPGSHPVRLIYHINDFQLWDNGGTWTIVTEVYREPGRLSIDRAEFTQGIQNNNNEVPLIADKRTFIRVFVTAVDDGSGPMSGVTARLSVNGSPNTYSPINSASITASPWGSDARSLNDSFLFELGAADRAAGTRPITVTLIPPPGRGGGRQIVRTWTLTFVPSNAPVELHLIGVRSSYFNVPPEMQAQQGLPSSWWQARPVSAWEQLRAFAENALPLARLTLTDRNADNPWGSLFLECRGVEVRKQWSCSGYEDGPTQASALVDTICPSGGCWIVLLQPEITTGGNGSHFVNGSGNHVINLQGEADVWQQGKTLAHEIGHGLWMRHPDSDPGFPRADGGMGPFVGLRYTPSIALIPGQDASGTTTTFDLMGGGGGDWFSPYTYCKGLPAASSWRVYCPGGMAG